MAWTVIPDSDIDPDSPVTTGLMTALRDNVAAAFAKDSGAPVLADNYIAPIMLPAYTTGNYRMGEAETGLGDVTGSTYVKQETKIVKQSGVINMRIGGLKDGGLNNGHVKIYVNGAAIGVERLVNSTSFVYWEEDITVAVDDLVQVYVRSTTAGQTKITFSLEFLVNDTGILRAAVDPTSI